ncbi:MAG: bifunctional hydroxymethylpyrimidine kinase/phosphomethylpyrimidine kinase [Clostridia bacterium]|nr:bifunctional hydroxymethylpyrimidine kinase/phosphomethylpyrimidine kinase [Clostridia bacterium]
MRCVLTIAGSDCSGGAGIQADLKTMTAHKVYGMSAITALTAQNTTGVFAIQEVTPEFLAAQLDAIFTDIPPHAVKIGMVASAELVQVIAEKLENYGIKNIVLDPVMVATSGSKLIQTEAIAALTEKLFPLATLVTPNIPEAEVLSGIAIHNKEEMIAAAENMEQQYGCHVLIKGGHLKSGADDLLWTNGEGIWLCAKRVNNPNTHGTGCTLSSAIACGLAEGKSLYESVQSAKAYLLGALGANLNLGRGNGPLKHC